MAKSGHSGYRTQGVDGNDREEGTLPVRIPLRPMDLTKPKISIKYLTDKYKNGTVYLCVKNIGTAW